VDFDELVDNRDDAGVIKALINAKDGVKYRNHQGSPLIQVLPNGTWFVQKKCGRGLGKDPAIALLEALGGKNE
jgi:hypothetical protein